MFSFYLPAALKPYAKALNAALGGIALVVLHGVVTGDYDVTALETFIGAGILSGVVFATPNDA